MPQTSQQFHKPLAVPGGLHPHQHRPRQLPIKPLGLPRAMLQLSLTRLSCLLLQPTNLLPTGVIITSYNQHRRLLPTDSFGPPNRSIPARERSLRSYPIKVSVFETWVFKFVFT